MARMSYSVLTNYWKEAAKQTLQFSTKPEAQFISFKILSNERRSALRAFSSSTKSALPGSSPGTAGADFSSGGTEVEENSVPSSWKAQWQPSPSTVASSSRSLNLPSSPPAFVPQMYAGKALPSLTDSPESSGCSQSTANASQPVQRFPLQSTQLYYLHGDSNPSSQTTQQSSFQVSPQQLYAPPLEQSQVLYVQQPHPASCVVCPGTTKPLPSPPSGTQNPHEISRDDSSESLNGPSVDTHRWLQSSVNVPSAPYPDLPPAYDEMRSYSGKPSAPSVHSGQREMYVNSQQNGWNNDNRFSSAKTYASESQNPSSVHFRVSNSSTGESPRKSSISGNRNLYVPPVTAPVGDPHGSRPDICTSDGSGNAGHYSSRDNWRPRTDERLPRRQRHSSQLYASSGAGAQLIEPRWEKECLTPIKKGLYVESPAVAARSDAEVAAFLQENHMHVEGEGYLPRPILTFAEAGFPPAICHQLQRMNFVEPSPIQKIGWPVALSGRDMIGIAQTGSGKTLGFLLPGLVHAAAQPSLAPGDGPIVLVLAPTRELAMQIRHECVKFTDGLRGPITNNEVEKLESKNDPYLHLQRCFNTACIYGGVPRHGQAADLRRGAEVLIATPGRLLDFLDLGVTNLKRVSYVVLDEADRMMDMGFEPQVRKVFSQIRPDRQTLLWSATWPKEVRGLASDFCSSNVIKLQVGDADLQANANVTQRVEVVSAGHLQQRLMAVLEELTGNKVLIFCETKRQCDRLCRELRYRQMRALAIHGDKEQRERDRILHDFRTGHCDILIATDVASRGLDIHDIKVVINYELPKNIESYIHRIGRTGRAGNRGTAISFFEYDYFMPEKVNMAKRICEVMRAVGQEPPQALLKIARA